MEKLDYLLHIPFCKLEKELIDKDYSFYSYYKDGIQYRKYSVTFSELILNICSIFDKEDNCKLSVKFYSSNFIWIKFEIDLTEFLNLKIANKYYIFPLKLEQDYIGNKEKNLSCLIDKVKIEIKIITPFIETLKESISSGEFSEIFLEEIGEENIEDTNFFGKSDKFFNNLFLIYRKIKSFNLNIRNILRIYRETRKYNFEELSDFLNDKERIKKVLNDDSICSFKKRVMEARFEFKTLTDLLKINISEKYNISKELIDNEK